MKNLLIILAIVLPWKSILGQEVSKGDLAFEQILPLSELIELAVQNAPGLQVFSTSQEQTREEIALNKKKWMRHIAFTAGVNYGNGVVSDQITSGVGTDNRVNYLTSENVFFNVGINLRLPFSELSSRKNEIKIQKLEIDRLEYLKLDQTKFIREEVIRRFKELKGYFISMELQMQIVEANVIALSLAENQFKKGQLEMKEYRLAIDENYSAKLEYEKSKNEAWYCIQSLNQIVGQSILIN